MEILEAKQKVLYWAKKGYEYKLFAGTSGNLSILLPEESLVVVTPSSIRYEIMEIEDIVVIDMDGNVVEGIHPPSSENKLHRAIYRAGLACSVIHTHSPFATSFAVNQTPIPLVLIEMIPFLGGEVPCTRLELPGTDELAEVCVAGLEGRNACLLSNHGAVTIGDTIEQAFIRAEYLEDCAKISKLASIGGEVVEIPADVEYQMKLRRKQREFVYDD